MCLSERETGGAGQRPGVGSTSSSSLHVAAAVILDHHNQVLLSLRPPHVFQGNLWEFPGGKVEVGEAPLAALARELDEELGIRLTSARPLIRVWHDYPEQAVLLEFWWLSGYQGHPQGREGQTIRWFPRQSLPRLPFPAGNIPVVRALQLPAVYLITPELGQPDDYVQVFQQIIQAGIPLAQLRAKHFSDEVYAVLAQQLVALCRGTDTRLLLNCAPEEAARLGADGVHLSSRRLMALSRRPSLDEDKLVGASCHNPGEMAQAHRLGLDFMTISPVLPTSSHPGATALGWQQFATLVAKTELPAYALGGLHLKNLEQAQACGAWGIAAVSAFQEPDALKSRLNCCGCLGAGNQATGGLMSL